MNVLNLGDPARHFWMTRSVARAMGISLTEAIAEGRMSPEGYTRMVSRCRTCQQVGHCESWLASVRIGTAETAPQGCLNTEDYAQARGNGQGPCRNGGSKP